VAVGGEVAVSREARERAHALIERLAPFIKLWRTEEEADARRALVQRLAERLFAAVDEERARIARDLHDDQAQLLAAARIALTGDRAEARAILKELEIELRRRTRDLRPPALGKRTLAEALDAERARLAGSGISARIDMPAAGARMPRLVQEVCFRVAREAFSNVQRHAGASKVTLAIRRDRGLTRISVADNGRGFDSARASSGSGLAGLRERLELLGGSLRIESTPRGVRLSAEVPELGS
jgi:signal transduction histidine kinase